MVPKIPGAPPSRHADPFFAAVADFVEGDPRQIVRRFASPCRKRATEPNTMLYADERREVLEQRAPTQVISMGALASLVSSDSYKKNCRNCLNAEPFHGICGSRRR